MTKEVDTRVPEPLLKAQYNLGVWHMKQGVGQHRHASK